MPLYCRRASGIITVSECSKRDIVRQYAVHPDRVSVVYEAAGPEFRPIAPERVEEARLRYALPDRYLLHVGTIEPRKNLTRLIEALQLLRDRGMHAPLVIVGGKGWLYDTFFRRLDQLSVRDAVQLTGYVPAVDLPLLYGAAVSVVMPSVYEGFGLPVLEAMGCGVPVACARTSSLPEVGGDAAVYFDPLDVPAMAQAIDDIWSKADLRAELRVRGLRQASRFSWERAAEETWAVYQRILG
jgi:glycosyltransferase involved in cell wall biosynthesis